MHTVQKNIHDIICRCHGPEHENIFSCDEYMKKYISSVYGKIICDGISGSNLETIPSTKVFSLWWNFECHDEYVIWTLTRLPIWKESEKPKSVQTIQNWWVVDITLIWDDQNVLLQYHHKFMIFMPDRSLWKTYEAFLYV